MADAELEELRQEPLYRLRRDLTPQQGFEAFECHQLLAVRFHRAARINATGMSEAKGWMRFFKEHFPRGDQYAELLWVRWRIALLRDAYPGPGVAISYGQAHGHWYVVNPGGLFINLESMWDDYEQSIDSMIKTLAADDVHRERSLESWRGRRWTVQLVHVPPSTLAGSVLRRLRPSR